jgi:ssDNA-binding Zn-finger/Zn-ribbon topoisomerase 1
MAAPKAKTGDRARAVAAGQDRPCPECGKPTRIVKRIKNREFGMAGGMYHSCTECDYAVKK